MAKRSRLAAGLLAAVLFAAAPPTGLAAGLTGPERNNFVESSFQSCFQEGRNDPANKATDVAIIAQYCVCYSNQMADRLINDDLKALDAAATTDSAALEAKLQPLTKASVETCVARFRK